MHTSGEDRLPRVRIVEEHDLTGDLLAIARYEDDETFDDLPNTFRKEAIRLAESTAFVGKAGRTVGSNRLNDEPGRIALWGLGPRDGVDPYSRSATWQKLVRSVGRQGVTELAVWTPPGQAATVADAERLARSVRLARYAFDRFKRESSDSQLETVSIGGPDVGAESRRGVYLGSAIAAAAAFARDLANTPPNVATPSWIAARAVAMAGERLEVDVIEPPEMQELGLGGLLAVGGGSSHGPRLVRLRYRGGDGPRVALVGKGVTFDTGGISIKPSKGMEEMKYDKCGACAVLGIVAGAVELALPLALDAYVPLAENMPSGAAYRPGDIVTCYDGTTVEILNTDAEGRMILADALALAAETDPDYLIDFATLTGASVVALGTTGAALYSADETLAAELQAAAGQTGERLWRMPLWPEFRKQLDSAHAELVNVGGRWGGANTAASFLAHFAGDRCWAHLDIAGPAAVTDGDKAARGATGYGVPLTLRWLLERAHA